MWRSTNAHDAGGGLAVRRGRPGVRVSLLATIAFVAIVSVVSTTIYAQAAQGSVTSSSIRRRQVDSVSFTNLASISTRLRHGPSKRSELCDQAGDALGPVSTSTREHSNRGARAPIKKARCCRRHHWRCRRVLRRGDLLVRTSKVIAATAINAGVRGFLIGAPIGAVTGGIVGAKFLF